MKNKFRFKKSKNTIFNFCTKKIGIFSEFLQTEHGYTLSVSYERAIEMELYCVGDKVEFEREKIQIQLLE